MQGVIVDRWGNTLRETVPEGAITDQVALTVAADAAEHPRRAQWLKLYNAGSFFDPGAIPVRDRPELARQARAFVRPVLERHPKPVGPRFLPFRDQLGAGPRL